MKHYSRPHGDQHAVSVAAQKVISNYQKDYQRQLDQKSDDNWLRNLATSGLVYREITGSTSKTERFLLRLAEVLERDKDAGRPTADIVAELERVTGIELEIQD